MRAVIVSRLVDYSVSQMTNGPDYGTKSLEDILRSLADDHRRYVIEYLSETDGEVASLNELVDYVATHCSDAFGPEEVAIRLHHVCLPKLDDAGLLEYDSRSETVRYRPEPLVEDLLDRLEKWDKEVSCRWTS